MSADKSAHGPVIMSVELEDVRFHAHHGVFPNERKIGNSFTLNVIFSYGTTLEKISDNLNDTVSYAELYEICRSEMMIPSALLEDVAARIARKVVGLSPTWRELEIRIRKDAPPIAGIDGAASVKLKISNPINR